MIGSIIVICSVIIIVNKLIGSDDITGNNSNYLKLIENENDSLKKKNQRLEVERTILYQEIKQLEDSITSSQFKHIINITKSNDEIKRLYSADVLTKLAIGDSIIRSRKSKR